MKNSTFTFLIAFILALFLNTPAVNAKSIKDGNAPDTVSKDEFPAVGHVYKVDFGKFQFHLDFKSVTELTFTSVTDPSRVETVAISVTKLRTGLFMVSWIEKSGSNVVHIEDFERKIAYTNISRKDGSFVRLKGSLIQVK